MGDVSQGLSYDPTFEIRSPTPHHLDKTASPSGRRMSDIHIPSPDHSVSITSSEHFDKAGLVAAQEAALHDAAVLEMGWTGAEADGYAFMPEGQHPKSPAIGSLQDLKCLKPIRLRNMKIGKVHRGRILSGTLCCKSVKIFAVMNVLEEEGTGDATKFVISNAVPRSATTATAQRLYPENAQLSVREPYLKRFADGMVGILVENPNDIIFNYLPDELPSPVSERENLLWPVYKDQTLGDGPDTPVFNTYGSFLSSPSPFIKNSLNSPRTPRSFLDEPLDGLTIRTIRRFKSFRKQDPGLDDDAEDSDSATPTSRFARLKSTKEDDGFASPRWERSSTIMRENPPTRSQSLGDLQDGHKAEETSKLSTDGSLDTRVQQIGESNGKRKLSSNSQDAGERDSIVSGSPEGGAPTTGHGSSLEATQVGTPNCSSGAGEASRHESDALCRLEGDAAEKVAGKEQAHGYESNGIREAQDYSEDEARHGMTVTRGDELDSYCTNSASGPDGGAADQPEARGELDVFTDPNAELENGSSAEVSKEESGGSGETLDACEFESSTPEPGVTEEKLDSEESSCSDLVRNVESQWKSDVGVDVEETLDKKQTILVGTIDQEEIRSLAVNAPEIFRLEEVYKREAPVEQSAAACVETVADTYIEQTECLNSTIEDKLEARDIVTVDSGKKVSQVISQEALEACAESLPSGVLICPKLLHPSNGNHSLFNGGEKFTGQVELLDVARATDAESQRDLQSAMHSAEACNGCTTQLPGTLADQENSKNHVEGSSHLNGHSSNGLHDDKGVDEASDQNGLPIEVRFSESEKDVGASVTSTDERNHSVSNGCSGPAVETSEEIVDSKSSEIIDAVVEEELAAAALRIRGNQRFARQDWSGAIELYTRAIDRAVQESKEQELSNKAHHVNVNNGETEMEVVMDYSNRAEAWLRLHHYERAWADAERALSLDPHHLKSLFRKGRALLGLGDYQQALTHLESAYARAPFDKDLLAAIKLSRIGDHQSRLGVYELTDFYLKGRFAGEVPTCADYVGPVQVKLASGEKGRGLFLTKHVEAGDLLLVSNPLAMLDSMSANKCRKNSLDYCAKGRLDPEVQEKLVYAVRERAKVSTKNRRRLLGLCYGDENAEQPVPSMSLFIPGRRIAPVETKNLDEERISGLVVRNVIDRNMVSTALERRHDPPRTEAEDNEERVFWGLWVLPSFINHSCIPNVSMVVIGRALFVYAARDLSAGEELLCSYFNVFQPLPQRREIASRCWGFKCKCVRCLLETRFESSLKKLYSLHSRLEPNPEFVLQFSPFAYKAPAKDLAKELEVIESSKKLNHRERCWLQASFTQLYTVSRDFMGPHGNYPYLEAALHAMEIVCPGSNSTLEVGLLVRGTALEEFHGKSSHYKAINQQVLRICQCIYGKQKPAVLESLVDGN